MKKVKDELPVIMVDDKNNADPAYIQKMVSGIKNQLTSQFFGKAVRLRLRGFYMVITAMLLGMLSFVVYQQGIYPSVITLIFLISIWGLSDSRIWQELKLLGKGQLSVGTLVGLSNVAGCAVFFSYIPKLYMPFINMPFSQVWVQLFFPVALVLMLYLASIMTNKAYASMIRAQEIANLTVSDFTIVDAHDVGDLFLSFKEKQ